jgi:hypothetical protein
MILQYSFYLNINIPGRKIFHVYYYRLSVPYAERIKGAASITFYYYDAMAVLLRCRNSNSPSRLVLLLRRQNASI